MTLFHDGQSLSLTGLPRVTPKDTTSFGDSFIAGFAAALLGGAHTEPSARAGDAPACKVEVHPGARIRIMELRLICRTKVARIYKKTGNLPAVQLLLRHTKMASIVRHLGVDPNDALTLSEGIDL